MAVANPLLATAASSRCEPTHWGEFQAYRLANEHISAVIVPALGRVMSFSRPGGDNWLWSGMTPSADGKFTSPLSWSNWGGDKTWLAPQSNWLALAGRTWPPDPTWGDPAAGPHVGRVLPSGGLSVTGPVSPLSGLRVLREYRLEGAELVITQTAENVSGPARTVALWSVTNVDPPEATFFVPSPQSAHADGYCDYRADQPPLRVTRQAGLLIVKSGTTHVQKLGFDTPWAALAVQRGRELFVQRAEHPAGTYPHGAHGVGSSAEYYDSGTGAGVPKPYVEVELLGPLTTLAPGQKTTLTVRWRLEPLPDNFTATDEQLSVIRGWLQTPVTPAAPAPP
jgi:hypothetical protein